MCFAIPKRLTERYRSRLGSVVSFIGLEMSATLQSSGRLVPPDLYVRFPSPTVLRNCVNRVLTSLLPLITHQVLQPPPECFIDWCNQHCFRLTQPLATVEIPGDGNCFFSAVSLILFGNSNHHLLLRRGACQYIQTIVTLFPELFLVNETAQSYLDRTRMISEGIFAEDVEVLSVCLLMNCDIYIFNMFTNLWQVFSPHLETELDRFKIYLLHSDNHFEPVVLMESHLDFSNFSQLFRSFESTCRTLNLTVRFGTKFSRKQVLNKHYYRINREKKNARTNEQCQSGNTSNSSIELSLTQLANKRYYAKNKDKIKSRATERYQAVKRRNNRPNTECDSNHAIACDDELSHDLPDRYLFAEKDNNCPDVDTSRVTKQAFDSSYSSFDFASIVFPPQNSYHIDSRDHRKDTRNSALEEHSTPLNTQRDETSPTSLTRKLCFERRRAKINARRRECYQAVKGKQNLIRNECNSVDTSTSLKRIRNKRYYTANRASILATRKQYFSCEKNRILNLRRTKENLSTDAQYRFRNKSAAHQRMRIPSVAVANRKRMAVKGNQKVRHQKRKSMRTDENFTFKKVAKDWFGKLNHFCLQYICVCCAQQKFFDQVKKFTSQMQPRFLKFCPKFKELKSVNGSFWLCLFCSSKLEKGCIPKTSVYNGFWYPKLSLAGISPTVTRAEEMCVAGRIPFMRIMLRPRGGQRSSKGPVLNVPSNVAANTEVIPRDPTICKKYIVEFHRDNSALLPYRRIVIRGHVVHRLAQKLCSLPLYQKLKIVYNPNVHFDPLPAENDISILDDQNDTETKNDESDDDLSEDRLLIIDDPTIATRALKLTPTTGEEPLSVYLDDHCEECAFPVLFAGHPRTENNARHVPVDYQDIVKCEMQSVNRSFAGSPENIFFKFKKKFISDVYSSVHYATRKAKGDITAGDLKADLTQLFESDKMLGFLKNVRFTPVFLKKLQNEFMAFIRQLGLPSLFITFSMSERNWPELLEILWQSKHGTSVSPSENHLEELSSNKVNELVNNDPVNVARFFHKKMSWMDSLLQSPHSPVGQVADFKRRLESQLRGSLHSHGLYWLKDKTSFDKMSAKNLCEYVDSILTTTRRLPVLDGIDLNEKDRKLPLVQSHKHTETCLKNRKEWRPCKYGFPFEPMPVTMFLLPLNTDLLQTKVSTEHYHRIRKEIESLPRGDSCEISFSDFLQKCCLNFNEYVLAIRSSLKAPKLLLKREPCDVRINAYNAKLLYLWRANLDIQLCFDPYAVVVYICAYISKSQKDLSRCLKTASQEAKNSFTSHLQQLNYVANSLVRSHEVTAQEAALSLLELSCTESSRKCVFIDLTKKEQRVKMLKNKKVIQTMEDDDCNVFAEGHLDRYPERPTCLEDICLFEWMVCFELCSVGDKTFRLKNGRFVKKLTQCRIARYFMKDKRQFPDIYRWQLFRLFFPHRNESEIDFLQETTHCNFADNLVRIETNKKRFDSVVIDLEEALVKLSARVDDSEPEDFQPFECFGSGSDTDSLHMDTQMALTSDTFHETGNVRRSWLEDDRYRDIIASLNDEQRLLLFHVESAVRSGNILRIFLSGGAGTGKSHLIKALSEMLKRKFLDLDASPDDETLLLLAPTGMAASHIDACTIHSGLCMRFGGDLDGGNVSLQTLQQLQRKYLRLKCVIIDEISLVAARFFSAIDIRLREITSINEPFGNLHVILVGDLFQLTPVLAKEVFRNPFDTSDSNMEMSDLWKLFFLFELKIIMRQADDFSFASRLHRLREGNQTSDDIGFFKSRVFSNDAIKCEDIRLCRKSQDVEAYNRHTLSFVKNVYTIRAKDKIQAFFKLAESKKQQILQAVGNFKTSDAAQLPSVVELAVGLQYMITTNIAVEDGLVNGAIGILRQITSVNNKPRVLWMEFNKPSIGSKQRRNFASYCDSNSTQFVPIKKIQRSFAFKKTTSITVCRKQFPVTIAAAITIHKSQGDTFKSCQVQFLSKQSVPGLHYTALSRVKSADGLVIVDSLCEKQIKTSALAVNAMNTMRTSYVLDLATPLEHFFNGGSFFMCFNIQSFLINFAALGSDCYLKRCSLIILMETWLIPSDIVTESVFPDYQLFRNDFPCQINRPHAGLLVFSKIQDLNVIFHLQHQVHVVEARSESLSLIVFGVHRRASATTIVELKNVLMHLIGTVQESYSSFFVGDFNVDNLKHTTLINFFSNYGFSSLHQQVTTKASTSLDHVYFRPSKQFPSPTASALIYGSVLSFHDPVFFRLQN